MSDVKWGAKWGLRFAFVYVAFATVQLLIGGSEVFTAKDTSYLAVVTAYILGGVAAGAVVGLLRRFAQNPIGAVTTGILASAPVFVGIRIALSGFQPWSLIVTLSMITLSLGWGIPAGLGTWWIWHRR